MAPFSGSPAGRVTAVEALSPVKVQLVQNAEPGDAGNWRGRTGVAPWEKEKAGGARQGGQWGTGEGW